MGTEPDYRQWAREQVQELEQAPAGPLRNGKPAPTGGSVDRRAVVAECTPAAGPRPAASADPEQPPAPGTAFCNFFEKTIKTEDSTPSTIKVGLSAAHLKEELLHLSGGWPRRVEGLLFVQGAGSEPLWLTNADQLFAWISRQLPNDGANPLKWAKGQDKVTQAQFFAYLQQTCERYDAVERFPHYPALPNHYYMHPPAQGGDGQALRQLLGRFSPLTDVDHDLILTCLLTLFWGGAPGQRPAWLVTTEDAEDPTKGRGAGKSALAKAAARLVGGHIQASARDDYSKLVTRLLSPGGLGKRVVLIDNIKSLKFSWAELEGLITADVISGYQMYAGEAVRPNTLLWFLTVNGASLSRDMAQRTVPIKVKRPEYGPDWENDTNALIDVRRWEIIGDCLALLRQVAQSLKRYSRWGAWEAGVLSRVPDPSECQKVIAERQEAIDDDAAEAATMREAFRVELHQREHDPEHDAVWIPSAEAAVVVNAATGERYAVNRAGAYLGTLSIPELRRSDRNGQRGWAWRGLQADSGATLVPLGMGFSG
jgi:hypothetical protein